MTDAFSHDNTRVAMMSRVLCPELTAFVAVGQFENLTAAADALGVLQPTLSRSIARLQRQMGLTLLARDGRSVRLTHHGRAILRHAERSLALLQTGLEETIADDDDLIGLVRFSFLRSFRAHAVPSILRTFRADRPGVRFSLDQGSNRTIVEGIANDDIDLGLVAPPPEDSRLAFEELLTEPIHLAVPAGHHLTGVDCVSLEEVADEDFILLQAGYGTRALTEKLCRRAGFSPRVAFETEDVTLARGLVEAGFGVSLLPPMDQETHPGVIGLSLADPEATRSIAVAWSADRPLAPPVAAFRDHLVRNGPLELSARGHNRSG